MKNISFAASFAVLSISVGVTPASAATMPTLGKTACAFTDISPTATSCTGFYEGNLVNGSTLAQQASALNTFLGTSFSAATLTVLETLPLLTGQPGADFATALYGDTVVGFHVGAAKGQKGSVGYQGTAFYRFDAGNLVGGLDKIAFNRAGLSNARLYSTGKFVRTAVPEPATWGMMLVGFGIVGSTLRRRRSYAIA